MCQLSLQTDEGEVQVVSPHEAWRDWIGHISNDLQMDLERLLVHLQAHVQNHIPNADANQHRWLQWLAGTYNLLGILSAMIGCGPTYEIGISRLFNKWRQHPFDHTPPPTGKVEIYRDLSDQGKQQY